MDAYVGVFVELEHFPFRLLLVLLFLQFDVFPLLQILFLSLFFRFAVVESGGGGVGGVRVSTIEETLLLLCVCVCVCACEDLRVHLRACEGLCLRV